MDRARPRGRHADADLAREPRVRTRHERGHLLVPHLHEVDLVFHALEGAEDAVDAVAGIAVDSFDAPLFEAVDEEVARRFCHSFTPRSTQSSREVRSPPASNRAG